MKNIKLKEMIAAYDKLYYYEKIHEPQKPRHNDPDALEWYKHKLKNYDEKRAELRRELTSASEELAAVIVAAEGRATARTVNTRDVIQAVFDLDNRLNMTAKAKKGITARIDCNAQKFPSAYKYTPYSTIVTVEFKPEGWTVTAIAREESNRYKYCLNLTDAAKAALIDNYTTF